ncbi:MAG: FUSC family protein [Thaumarchaeota archaeon]|nr:FUSC family protein [Nitrososphaerota archaeon]
MGRGHDNHGRPAELGLTVTFSLTMVIGTVVGALIAAAITLGTSSPYVLSVLLFAFSVLMFAGRGVNAVLFQMFLVPFIIILLNIIYPGQWYFAFDRILDVAIGGAIAISVVYVFDAVKNLGRHGKLKTAGPYAVGSGRAAELVEDLIIELKPAYLFEERLVATDDAGQELLEPLLRYDVGTLGFHFLPAIRQLPSSNKSLHECR